MNNTKTNIYKIVLQKEQYIQERIEELCNKKNY